MQPESQTRHSRVLPELRFSLNLLYVGRLLLGMNATTLVDDSTLTDLDERIEMITDELVATELLHEAALLAGDRFPNVPPDRDV